MKKYVFTMEAGNGITEIALVTRPEFESKGNVRMMKVGTFQRLNDEGHYLFKKCEEHEMIAGGGPYMLEEYNGTIES